MKLWKKILLGLFGLVTASVAVLAITLSYTADCEPYVAPAAGTPLMTAVRSRCYGSADVLLIEDVAKPEPGPDDILVRVRAAGVNPLDYHFMRGTPYFMRLIAGIGRPTDQRLGVDFAGVVEATGVNVSRFAVGDEVFGGATGAFAEYLVIPANRAVVKKPANVSFDQAAAVAIAAVTALQALQDKGQLGRGDEVLINGASGGVGTFAVQIARAMGATVTGVCSTRNVELVKSLGANAVVDYKKEDYSKGDARYDLVVDMVGNHSPSTNHGVLKDGGKLVLVGGPKGNWFAPAKRPLQAMWTSMFVEEEIIALLAELNPEDMQALADMMAAGSLVPVVDRTYSLDEVPEALRYSESGRARGKIIIRVD